MSKHFELMQQMERGQRAETEQSPGLVSETPRASGFVPQRWASEEALRLVQQVFFLQTQEPPRVVVFAGMDHGNGCSEICAAVAETLAKHAGRPVCLMEGNFRTPALPGLFGMTNHHGLTDALLKREEPVASFAKSVNQENLWLLSSGILAADSPSLLHSESIRERLLELRKTFDYIIIDAPPLTRYSDAVALGHLSNGMILILEAEATRKETASGVTADLRAANIPILAAVLNKRNFPIPKTIYNRI